MSKKTVDRMRFRVWDEERKKYWLDGCYISQKGEIVTTACDDGCCLELDGNEVIEQCTGLRDKNGTLIYEGDVFGYFYRLTVKWSELRASFYIQDQDGCVFYNLEETDLSAFKIVGNVHEGVGK